MILKTLVFSLTVAVAAPAIAQQSPLAARNTLNDQMAYQDRMQRQLLDAPTERAAPTDPDQNPRRARRAQAAAALINAGDCPGALALAERERDRRLIGRINQICTTSTVSAPVAVDERRD